MSSLQRVCVLGSTGSIGVNTLDVIARHPDRYEVVALSAMSRVDALAAQCLTWRPRFAVMPDRAAAAQLRAQLREAGCATEVLDGAEALAEKGYTLHPVMTVRELVEIMHQEHVIDDEHYQKCIAFLTK
jgi:1-deoxy-D-xylulose-5-phosphate reductoisomerase